MHLNFFVLSQVEGRAKFNVFLGKVISVNEHLADLVCVFGVFAVFWLIAVQ